MHTAPSTALLTGPTTCDHDGRPASVSPRTKFLIAGVAMASAGVLAVTPVTPTPALPDVRVAPADLAASEHPLEVWQSVFTGPAGLFVQLETLSAGISTASGNLAAALQNPVVQAQFGAILGNLTDPERVTETVAALPGYGDRLSAAGAGLATQFGEALAALPAVLQLSAGHLAQGRFLEAYGEVNLWFLTAGLADFRGSLLDAFRVPGDFLDSVGLEPLARILGTSWMDEGTQGPGYGPGLLSRGIIGNFGRALLAPQVTAIFQTVEILDTVGAAVQVQDFQTAAGELIDAPAKITNAFLNGYIPAFVGDPDGPFPPGPGQSFPGFFSQTGTVDFFLRQVPAEIARALQHPRPAELPASAGADELTATLVSHDAEAVAPPSDSTQKVADTPGGADTSAGGADLSAGDAGPGVDPADGSAAGPEVSAPTGAAAPPSAAADGIDTDDSTGATGTRGDTEKPAGVTREGLRKSEFRTTIRDSIRSTIRGGATTGTAKEAKDAKDAKDASADGAKAEKESGGKDARPSDKSDDSGSASASSRSGGSDSGGDA